MLHLGRISVREITEGPGLHLSLTEDSRIFVHVDKDSPATGSKLGGVCRYGRARVATHLWREVVPMLLRLGRPAPVQSSGVENLRRRLRDAEIEVQSALARNSRADLAVARVTLGAALEEIGELGQAASVYRQVIEAGVTDVVSPAVFNLGIVLEKQDDLKGATEAYRQAADSDHPEFGPWAWSSLGELLENKLQDPHGAREAYLAAIATDHPEIAPWAAIKLGGLLAQRGQYEEAEKGYRRAIDSRHPEFAP